MRLPETGDRMYCPRKVKEEDLISIEIFGIIAISIMVISYALEDRNPIFIALFAFGCAAAAIYAFLISSYPFLVAESIWSLIAIARWRRATKV